MACLEVRSLVLVQTKPTKPFRNDSETSPHEGTLQVFPDVLLSNAYIILRPFFRLKDNLVTDDPLDPENWVLGKTLPNLLQE